MRNKSYLQGDQSSRNQSAMHIIASWNAASAIAATAAGALALPSATVGKDVAASEMKRYDGSDES